jgi:hypothetical protein
MARQLSLNGLMTANQRLIRARVSLKKVQGGWWSPDVAEALAAVNAAQEKLMPELHVALRKREAEQQAANQVASAQSRGPHTPDETYSMASNPTLAGREGGA